MRALYWTLGIVALLYVGIGGPVLGVRLCLADSKAPWFLTDAGMVEQVRHKILGVPNTVEYGGVIPADVREAIEEMFDRQHACVAKRGFWDCYKNMDYLDRGGSYSWGPIGPEDAWLSVSIRPLSDAEMVDRTTGKRRVRGTFNYGITMSPPGCSHTGGVKGGMGSLKRVAER